MLILQIVELHHQISTNRNGWAVVKCPGVHLYIVQATAENDEETQQEQEEPRKSAEQNRMQRKKEHEHMTTFNKKKENEQAVKAHETAFKHMF